MGKSDTPLLIACVSSFVHALYLKKNAFQLTEGVDKNSKQLKDN